LTGLAAYANIAPILPNRQETAMTTTARGAIARTPKTDVSIEEFTIDDPAPNEVCVRILASGVCHTDLGVKDGVYGTAQEADPVARIKEITGGNGVNYSFEAVGKAQTLEQALWSRDLAGTCVFIGVPGPGPTLELPLQRFFDLGGSLRVSWYGDCLPTRDFPMLATWYAQGKLDLDGVVTRTIALGEVDEAFEAMKRGETLRSVIVF
jgi:Zn-dependent alcohol dehydrogenase